MKPPGALDRWNVAFARASVAARELWLLRQLAPAYQRSPGVSAIVGRGCFDDLDAAFSEMAPADRRGALDGLACAALGIEPSPPVAPAPPPRRLRADETLSSQDQAPFASAGDDKSRRGQSLDDPRRCSAGARRFANDPVADFERSHLRHARGARIQSSRLHEAYLRWAEINDRLVLTNNMLTKELMRRGLSKLQGLTDLLA